MTEFNCAPDLNPDRITKVVATQRTHMIQTILHKMTERTTQCQSEISYVEPGIEI